jgi:tetratricopeptide (TPR) repeat protein
MIATKKRRGLLGALAVLSVALPLWSDGLPGEYLLTQRWRDLFAGHSALHNPAFLADENYGTVRLAGSRTLQGAFYIGELGYTQPIGLYQSVGATWFLEDDGIIEGGQFDPTTGQLNTSSSGQRQQNHFMVLSYAVNPLSRLCVGVNLNVAYQTLFGTPKLGVGADLGLSYRLLRHPILGEHVVGAFFQNIVPPRLFDVSSQTEEATPTSMMAVNLKASWMAKFWERRIEVGLDADFKDLYSQAKDFGSILDTNGNPVDPRDKKIEFDFNGRVGFWIFRMIKTYVQFGSQYWGLGAGLNAPRFNNGRDLMLMYQYMSMTQGEAANAHSWYILAEVGKHREEMFARKMARLANVLPNDLYNKACRLYSEAKYWDAFFVFGQIVSQFPDFFKNDWVEYYRASCLEQLDMRAVARTTYEDMKRLYPRSEVVPMADLGIMRVDYRNDYTSGVQEQFGALNQPKVRDSLKFHAYYLMGETYMKEKDWTNANQAFSQIPEEHPEYIFAQHSQAITNILMNRLEPAMSNLENCLQTKATTASQQEIVNRSAVFMGYLFYEQNSLSKAVTALRMVQKNSYYYPDALLGMGWTALKARQWLDCINSGKEIFKYTTKPELQCEGMLLEAYGNFMLKNYTDAAATLKLAMDKLATLTAVSRDSLGQATRDNEQERISYDFLAKEAKKMSVLDQSSAVLRIIDSLATDQQRTLKDLKKFDLFRDEFYRREFFARGIDRVREDLDYAQAVVMKLVNKGDMAIVEQKAREKQASIDAEIEKLKQQLQEQEAAENKKKK